MPSRLQRSRASGWRAPAGTVYVGRGAGAYGRWGNPFRGGALSALAAVSIGGRGDDPVARARGLVALHAHWLAGFPEPIDFLVTLMFPKDWNLRPPPTVDEIRAALAGRDLLCWCPLDRPCHADTLLAIANRR